MRLANALCLLSLATAAHAQVATTAAAEGRQRPGGQTLASLPPGAPVTPTGETSGDASLVTMEGWVDASRLGSARDSFPATVSGRITLRLRSRPSTSGDIIATLQPGAGVHVIARQGTWARVRRSLWITSSALPAGSAAANTGRAQKGTRPPPPLPAQAVRTREVASPAAPAQPGKAESRGVISSGGARVHDLPSGSSLGSIAPGGSVEVVSRQPGWVRVRLDGWVPDGDVEVGASAAAPGIRAADLRADPAGMKGRVVRWEVEVMALQNADPIRVEMAPDEPYLLARGPGTENVVLYLAVPPNLLAEARSIAPLTKLTVTARVRSGRSEPAGTPILDLLTIERR
ncbi:MAG: SH3 domain-containing protein [Gemmatimonadaceae bacterium]|nr:SH3 domain-containing protein [Gemmatimonadaceae bacterium]